MPTTDNLGLRFTRLLDASPEARADFEEILAQFRQWHCDALENEAKEVERLWLCGQLQQLTKLAVFIEACRERIAMENIPPRRATPDA